jgi:predicted O-linked N-acetylglucosamine transferase (SPINDLY family)
VQRFRARIEAAFAAAGVDPQRHLIFLPAKKHPEYLAGIARATLVLDSPWFSGGATTLDAFSVGAPVLAWESPMARGRQTSGMLRMMDLDELIAVEEQDYIAKAVAFCRDQEHCGALRARILANKTMLFDDDAPVRAFAAFLETAAIRTA